MDDAGPGPTEVLAHGRERTSWRWTRRHRAVAAVVALLVLALSADRWVHADEVRTARADLVAAKQTADHADGLVQSTFDYTTPLIVSTRAPDEVRAGLRALVMQAAGQGAEELRGVRARVASTPVLPWHRDVVRSRQATLAYLDAKIAFLAAGSRDYSALNVQPPEIAAALDRARALSP